MNIRIIIIAALIATGLTACVNAPAPKDYTAFRAADPRSLLVLPALNNTVSVEAPDFFLSTVSRPFAERGYYVFPALMVKKMLEQEGLADAGLVHQTDTRRIGKIFDCDAALYISIEQWDSKYAILATTTTVSFNYALRSCKTGDTLWETKQSMAYTPQQSNSGNPLADLIAAAIVAGLQKAAPNYIPLAQQANFTAAAVVGRGLPSGPYQDKWYLKDTKEFPAQP